MHHTQDDHDTDTGAQLTAANSRSSEISLSTEINRSTEISLSTEISHITEINRSTEISLSTEICRSTINCAQSYSVCIGGRLPVRKTTKLTSVLRQLYFKDHVMSNSSTTHESRELWGVGKSERRAIRAWEQIFKWGRTKSYHKLTANNTQNFSALLLN